MYLDPLAIADQSKNPDIPFPSSTKRKRPGRNIVYTKCEIAKAQLLSMQFSGDEKNFELLVPNNITNIPDAQDRVRLMEATIADQLEACNYKSEVYKAIHELVVLGTGILKGPVNSGKMRKRYVPQVTSQGQTIWVPEVTVEKVPEIVHVPLWLAFPDDNVTSLADITDFIELHPLSRTELAALRKNDGFIAAQIDEALKLGPMSYQSEQWANFTSITDSNPDALRQKYVCLEYHGPIPDDVFDVMGMEPPPYEVPEGEYYYGEVWVCNNKVIRIELENIEGCFKPPYSGDVWQEDPSSPFGFGVAEKLSDLQRVVTQAWHMILDNASASSAPQVVINEEMIDPRNGDYEIAPGKIWYFTDISGDVKQAFQYFETPNVTANIFPVMQFAEGASEEESGIALFAAGLQSPEVGTDTATGQAIMQKSATVLLDHKSDSWDINAATPRLRAMYDWNMQYNPDEKIKMDMVVRVKPATSYRNKQLNIRDMEKLSLEVSQNPMAADHIDVNALFRARFAMMKLPSQDLVKTTEQVEYERANRPPAPPDPALIKAMADAERVKLEAERLRIEQEKLDFERTHAQQREAWEREERMVATYARIAEAEAQLVKSQNEKEIALLQLAAKMETEQERARLTAGISVMSEQTKLTLAGMQAQQKARDQLLTEREIDLKQSGKTGI